jgi:hypothetical protein
VGLHGLCPGQFYFYLLLEILRLTTVGVPPRRPRDTPLFTKVGTQFHGQVAVAQSGLKATEFECGSVMSVYYGMELYLKK